MNEEWYFVSYCKKNNGPTGRPADLVQFDCLFMQEHPIIWLEGKNEDAKDFHYELLSFRDASKDEVARYENAFKILDSHAT